MIDDHYPTCARTYATLRIYSNSIDPDEITLLLGINPTSIQRCGELVQSSRKTNTAHKLNGWFLTSDGALESRDIRQHLNWLLDQLASKEAAIRSLQLENCRMDISCYWLARDGHGGPTISPRQMEALVKLNLELWFDVY
jgi:hypothetical protein